MVVFLTRHAHKQCVLFLLPAWAVRVKQVKKSLLVTADEKPAAEELAELKFLLVEGPIYYTEE